MSSSASRSSCGLTLAVPSLPTTTPAAVLASMAASASGAPAATASARTLSTVSPAPVTSKTCLAHARVGHFKTRRWNVQMARRGLLKYAHPFFTARDHHCAAAEVREQRVPRLFHGFLVRQRARDVETRFLGIAHDGPRSAIRV